VELSGTDSGACVTHITPINQTRSHSSQPQKTAFHRQGGTSGRNGKIFVTSPIPFVRPSRNSSRDPMLMYSGRLKNRKVTTAFSLVWIPL